MRTEGPDLSWMVKEKAKEKKGGEQGKVGERWREGRMFWWQEQGRW